MPLTGVGGPLVRAGRLVVIVLDQLSKWVVLANIGYGRRSTSRRFWNWVLTFNRGLQLPGRQRGRAGKRWFFTVLALAVSGWIALMLRRHAERKLLSLALALIMGGRSATSSTASASAPSSISSNGTPPVFYWPAFNVADSAITVGAV